MVKKGDIKVGYIPAAVMIAHMFTKSLGPQLFVRNREGLGMR